eukprot:987006-Rhodomonas_salina.1
MDALLCVTMMMMMMMMVMMGALFRVRSCLVQVWSRVREQHCAALPLIASASGCQQRALLRPFWYQDRAVLHARAS